MTVICPDCKNEFGPDDEFCANCGRPRPQPLQKTQTMMLSTGRREETKDDKSQFQTALTADVKTTPALPLAVDLPTEEIPLLTLPVDGPPGFDALAPVATEIPTASPVPPAPTYKPNPDPWLCKQCNTLNVAEDEYCNICGALRVSSAPEPVPEPVLSIPMPQPVDLLEKVLAPHKEGDPRLGWRYISGQATNEGVARFGSANEDSVFWLEISRMFESKPDTFGLYIVADGMGGQDAGEVASRLAIEAMSSAIMQELAVPWLSGQKLENIRVEATLRRAVQAAHQRVLMANRESERDSGTTITSACLVDGFAAFANVGDSRTYLFRPYKEKEKQAEAEPDAENESKNKTVKLSKQRTDKLSINGQPNGANHAAEAAQPHPSLEIQRVTRDQSLVQNLVDRGEITLEQVYSDPRRNVVLNAVGAPDEDIPIDTYQRELEPGDRILLCSDGMWEMARDEAIAERILSLDDPQICADELVALACRNGGADNVSVVVVQVEKF